jgi:DDE family transposase
MESTPFFPPLRAQLAAQGRRHLQTLRTLDLPALAQQLRELIPVHLLASEDEGPNSRERIFSLRLTFECFVWQMLKPKTSCREVVRAVQVLFKSRGESAPEQGTGGYIQARQRLPLERLERTVICTAQSADQRVGQQGRLRGRPVKAIDCSTTQLPDTPKNQKQYPQQCGQKPGCGFPLLKFLVLFSLSSGAILRVALGHWRNHELRLVRGLMDALQKGDILLGDRAYGEYLTLASMPQHGVDVVARLHGARRPDFRKSKKRFARHDALFEWKKGYQQSAILTAAQWRQVPETIQVRVIRFEAVVRKRKKRILLVTTLLDPVAYSAEELIALYARRWNLELALRHLKTTMGMEVLRCQTPEMARKELFAYLVAYNLIRCLMAETVALTGAQMDRLSFKGAMDAVRQYTAIIHSHPLKKRRQLWNQLLSSIAGDLVPQRPGRHEPRAVKRRKKPYPLLTRHRKVFREIPHPSRYRKEKPSQNRALI